MVPTQTFKAVYVPRRNEVGAYLVDNTVGATVQIISIANLEKASGISVFPSISMQVKNSEMRLPEPKEGLAIAQELKAIIDSVLAEMEKTDLPDKVAIASVEIVDNPFD